MRTRAQPCATVRTCAAVTSELDLKVSIKIKLELKTQYHKSKLTQNEKQDSNSKLITQNLEPLFFRRRSIWRKGFRRMPCGIQ